MTSTYGTRRASAAQAQAAELAAATGTGVSMPIGIARSSSSPGPSNSVLFGTSLSSSAGRSKRPTTMKQRRMSSSSSTLLRGSPHALATAQSLPATNYLSVHAGTSSTVATSPASTRTRSTSTSVAQDAFDADGDDGELKPSSSAYYAHKKARGETYMCEKCNKVPADILCYMYRLLTLCSWHCSGLVLATAQMYAHERCLVKHRWEHTAHWKEASKLLLSKHQQVQLLEAAAILKAASSGASLPEEKSFWPAAVSPPSSGLLGSDVLNINTLTSPRLNTSLALIDDLDLESEAAIDDQDQDEDDTGEDVDVEGASTSGDDALDEGMFDLDLGGTNTSPPPMNGSMDLDASSTTSGPTSDSGRSRSVGRDSGFGSLGAEGVAASGAVPPSLPRTGAAPPTMGFFKPQQGGAFVR